MYNYIIIIQNVFNLILSLAVNFRDIWTRSRGKGLDSEMCSTSLDSGDVFQHWEAGRKAWTFKRNFYIITTRFLSRSPYAQFCIWS